jgi:hypothetical protein
MPRGRSVALPELAPDLGAGDSTVWRIKLNSMRAEEDGGAPDWDAAKEYCRTAGLVGVGWGLSKLRHNARLETVLNAWRVRPDGATGVATIARLATQVKDGDLMWTRDRLGRFWLCKITGPWRFDKSSNSVKFDLYNVRPAAWLKTSYRDFDVPGAVVRSFTGPGQTLRRIGENPAASRISHLLWTHDADGHRDAPAFTPEDAITETLDPIDIEDLVLLSMQAKGWILIPSSRMHDTPMYEAALRKKGSAEVAVVSVKSGPSNPVPMQALAAAAGPAKAFAYSTHGLYAGHGK